MMKKLTASFVLLAALAGCVPSINPLYTDKDLVFDPALIGVWGGETENETWTFEKAGDKKYKLLHTDEHGLTGQFDAHLVKLEKYLFLDIYVVDPGEKEEWKINQLARAALIMRPGHLLLKVSQIKPTLQLGLLQPEWLSDLLKETPKAIRHEKIRFGSGDEGDYQIVLTAETKALQKFVLKYADSEKAFGNKPTELQRKPNALGANTKPGQSPVGSPSSN